MPYYSFATYADYREEWAIKAASLDHARALIGTDPDGAWLRDAFHIDADVVESRDEFVTDEDGVTPMIQEITPSHFAWRALHADWINRSLQQNIAALSAELHTHNQYQEFYDRFGQRINGFVGNYDLCIGIAEALTEWEIANGLGEAYETSGVSWIDVVEDLIDSFLENAISSDDLPDLNGVLNGLQILQRGRS